MALFFSSPVLASGDWVIDNFKSEITIQEDGKVNVSETIDVNFGSLQKRGIFRDIPYIYNTENGSNIYTEIKIQSVSLNGQPVPVKQSKIGNFLRLQIGDAGKIVSGKLKYQIKYLATGVLRGFEGYDELFWDVTGNGWDVPINKAEALVTLPQPGLLKVTCFQGIAGSKTPCNQNLTPPSKVDFTASRQLNASEGLTIVVGYKKGLVPILQVSPPSNIKYTSREIKIYPPNGWAFLVSLMLGVGGTLWWWLKKGREQPLGAIMAEYTAPDNLRPAEVGTLLDERADTLDVSATIIDLAVRGFLTIEESQKKWLFGSTDYILTKKSKDGSELLNYEKNLLNKVFAGGDVIKLSELKNEFYDDLEKVKKELYQDLVDKKYFPVNPEKVKDRYTALGIVIFTLSWVSIITGSFEPLGILSAIGLAMVIVGFTILVFSRSFAKRTPLGNQTFKKVLGFKLFMEKVEIYRQRYMEKENLFNELLPYAIVFGITEKFAQAFKDLGIKTSQPDWYISNRPFNPILFGSSINNFSSSLTSSISSQPSARNSFVSSGSGFRGGSSGGGFGGGGGGSW